MPTCAKFDANQQMGSHKNNALYTGQKSKVSNNTTTNKFKKKVPRHLLRTISLSRINPITQKHILRDGGATGAILPEKLL